MLVGSRFRSFLQEFKFSRWNVGFENFFLKAVRLLVSRIPNFAFRILGVFKKDCCYFFATKQSLEQSFESEFGVEN